MPINNMVSSDGKVVTLQISGRFDFAMHQEFMQAYKAYERGSKEFVVDLGKAEYMDSSALGMLLQLRDYGAKSGSVELRNSNDSIREILRIANFDKLFKVS